MTRWKAAALHFLISLIVIGTIAALIVWRWYPPALFGMARAGGLLSTIAGVDLVLGPLLTLIVYKAGKKTLRFDLTVIALLQIAALAFGLHVVWQSRPVYVVAISDRFRMVFANEIDEASRRRAPAAYRALPAWGPVTVAAPLPKDGKRQLEIMLDAFSGLDISQQPEYFQPYPAAAGQTLANALPASRAIALAPAGARAAWQTAIGARDDAAILPIVSSRGSASVLLDRRSGRILGFTPLDPWPIFNKPLNVQNHPEKQTGQASH